MLHLDNCLLFPSLVYQKDFTIKRPDWTKDVRLYKLDWKKVELEKEEHHKKWNKNQWPDLNLPYVPTLPEELDKEVENYTFALDRGYLNEIQRCSQQGLQEWNIRRPFDTMIREMCLKVPFSYIKVAFSLLSDCIFEEETGYWDRGNRRECASLMLYKFWCHQTGRGLLTSSDMSGWSDEYAWIEKWTEDGEARDRAKKINGLLEDHQKQLNDAIAPIYIKAEEGKSESRKIGEEK
jgi:hypothetical protein